LAKAFIAISFVSGTICFSVFAGASSAGSLVVRAAGHIASFWLHVKVV
jgi:hypothetical protein